MIDGAKSRQIAYDYVTTIEKVRFLDYIEKIILGFETELEIWEVSTEVSHNNTIIPVVLHIELSSQFPLEFPKIFLSPVTFEKTKYIPHVNNSRLICTYDPEIASTNPEDPAGIVVECIRKSKSIILDGISKNNSSDFTDEFKAYWEEKYGKEKYIPHNLLSLIDKINPNSQVKLICLKRKIINYIYVLHNSNETANKFKDFLKEYKFEYNEIGVYILGKFSQTTPPFELKNRDIINIIKSSSNEAFEKFKVFINNKEFPKLVVCEKHFGQNSYLFGWFHKPTNTNVKGYRPETLNQFSRISTVQSNENVDRITTDVFTKERLENRTSGININAIEKTFLIAGIGSIGSNLIYFLNSINFPNFKFIDSDILRLENIQRHLLGFEYIGSYKTKALKDYILKNNPLQNVSTKEKSIVDIINNEINYLNETDYIFTCIGKANIDNLVCQSLKNGIINKPIFMIWVEPFLCGGHCIYLHPSNPEFENYFEDDIFKFNVIDKIEYKSDNKHLSLRESGCQTTYIPYSGSNVLSFISSIFQYISSIIDYNKTESLALSWIGDIDNIKKLGIKTSTYYDKKSINTIIVHNYESK
jgi:molybdopterin/thiamine biosynthesis adenylyltransferase